jgi:glutamate-1-semialdehyde 2,1-aminomutase
MHHFLLNRGVVITPFHNMMLICPATTDTHVETLIRGP